jgi:hypothetical protein
MEYGSAAILAETDGRMGWAGLVRLSVRTQVKELCSGVIRRSPVVLHECIIKRHIEFNFSPEEPSEGEGKACNTRCVLGLAVLCMPISLLYNREIIYRVLS